MNRDEIITIKYTRFDNGTITPLTKQITVKDAINALESTVQLFNDFTLHYGGVLIVSLAVTDFVIIVNFEDGTFRRIDSVERFSEFLHGLTVTKLFQNPDSGLMAMYPISLEMWLWKGKPIAYKRGDVIYQMTDLVQGYREIEQEVRGGCIVS